MVYKFVIFISLTFVYLNSVEGSLLERLFPFRRRNPHPHESKENFPLEMQTLNAMSSILNSEANKNQSENFDRIERTLSELNETSIDLKSEINIKAEEAERKTDEIFGILMKKISDLEDNLNQKLDTQFDKMTKTFEENLNQSIGSLKKVTESTQEINLKLSDLEQKFPLLENNVNRTLELLQMVPVSLEKMNQRVEMLKMKIPEVENQTIKKTTKKKIFRDGCKEYTAYGRSYKRICPIEGEHFKHLSIQRNHSDALSFEMHMGIRGAKDAFILLSPVADPGVDDFVFEIGVGTTKRNERTVLQLTMDSETSEYELVAKTPNIISPDEYREFYIKISDGKLLFGKEGESDPIINYPDQRVNSVKYIGMASWGQTNNVSFLYDCPVVETD